MTPARSKNSHFGLHVYGLFMISWPMVFLLNEAFMGD
jgi:hypothetical protein